ncbi:uncharacterized protein LOC106645190 [Copidosoma floridanum]|uniref:uncharacterized protein LOC106645190 n=1 Tax=Copidosoma floridanum TaxID=29053 RepID=UPI0006C99D26|nr:uncharacterized protein LOC106645190 [Copidosoma floridanum]
MADDAEPDGGLTIGSTTFLVSDKLVIKQEPEDHQDEDLILESMDEDPSSVAAAITTYEDGTVVAAAAAITGDTAAAAITTDTAAAMGEDSAVMDEGVVTTTTDEDDTTVPIVTDASADLEYHQGHVIDEDVDDDDEADIEESFADLTFPEDSDVVMQRAVSPPSYVLDSSEERIKELTDYYKEKHNFKEAQIKLQSCDKIWETLQLIKNVQNSFCDDNDDDTSCQYIASKDSASPNESSLQPLLINASKSVPDFRFSVKSKKKLFYCITCGKEFFDSIQLKQHATEKHGIFVNPKRVYKPRGEANFQVENTPIADNSSVNKGDCKIVEENESLSRTESTNSVHIEHPENENCPQQTINVNSTTNKVLVTKDISKESVLKEVKKKEKIKCVLCKRITTDIVYHMKGYHKVACVRSIIEQCEKVTTDDNYTTNSANAQINSEVVAHEQNKSNFYNSTEVPIKKKKRNKTCWTIKKKKHMLIDKSLKPFQRGPFKCNVCLGIYKNLKTFTYHKSLHRIRGETPQNFDPSKCRFFNSPLRTLAKTVNQPLQNVTSNNQREVITPTTDGSSEHEDPGKTNEGSSEVSEDFNMEQTKCECGRLFRNYHTLYLHKVKCKGTIETSKTDKSYSNNSNNDADSGISISIKIKKNKNDSYEVVPSNMSSEDNYKDFRNSKDSDASSNDSGMVSVDYNGHRANNLDVLSKYSKSHSILRIQVAEDDEDVDIEDGEDSVKVIPKSFKEKNVNGLITNEDSDNIPSLTNLCQQILSNEKPLNEGSGYENPSMNHTSKMLHNIKSNCPCGKNFKNFKYLNIHVRRYHPLLPRCAYCLTNFDRIEKYIGHECKVVEGKLFIEPIIQTQCIECKALVDLGEPFDKHMKTHNLDSTTFQCFKCDMKFDNQHQRKAHFNIEHGFSLCRICNKLLHIDHLYRHEAYHDGLGHPCHVCKKTFSQKVLLKKHIQYTHDSNVNEVVKCTVCLKKMKLRQFQKHLSFHLHAEICGKCNRCLNGQEKLGNEKEELDDSIDYTDLNYKASDTSVFSEKQN